MRSPLGSLLCWCVALGACATIPRPPGPPRTIAVDEGVSLSELPGGLRLLATPAPGSNLAHVLVRYDAGSRDDPPGKAGLAHLVEHLSFELRGAGATDAPTIEDDIRAVALDYNAATSWEYTEYTATVLASDIDAVFAAEARRLRSRCADELSESVFEREREVVRNERRTRRRDPTGTLAEELRVRAYGTEHPYARPIGGDEEQLAALTREDVCEFMERHYGTNRATIVVVGGADRGEVAHRATLRFAGARTAPSAEHSPVGHSQHPGARATLSLAVERGAVYVAWRAPPMQSRPGLAAIVALQLAKEQLARDNPMPVDVFVQGGQQAPLLGLWIGLDHEGEETGAVARLWDAIDTVLADLHEDDLKAMTLGEARDRLFAFESMAARATLYADYAQFQSAPAFFAGDLDILEELTVPEVRAAGRQLFRRNATTTLVVRPDDAGGEYQRGPGAYAAGDIHADGRDASLDAARLQPAVELDATDSALERAETIELAGGLRAVLLPMPGAPTVVFRLVFPVGRADEPAERPGLARFAANLLDVPADAPLRPPTRREIWDSGGQYSWRVSEDATAFQVRGLAAYADRFAGYLGALYSFGDYAPAYVRIAAERRRRELDRDSVAHRSDFLAAFGRLLYGPNHPYAFVSELAGLRRGIDAQRLARFHRRHYGADNATLFVVGNFDRALALQWLEHWFVRTRVVGATGGAARPPAADARQPLAVELARPGPVIDIALAFATTRGDAKDHAALLILRGVLDRRALDIRKRLAVAYSAFAAIDDPVGPGALRIAVTADARRARAATEALSRAVQAVRDGNDDDPDLARDVALARRDVVRELLAESTSTVATADALQYLTLRGLPADYFQQVAQHAGRLDVADVVRAAGRILARDQERAVLQGPADATAAARAALGY